MMMSLWFLFLTLLFFPPHAHGGQTWEEVCLGYALDEDYDIARILADPEFPPVISRLLGAEGKTLVLPESQKENYAKVIEYFSKKGAAVTEGEKIGEEPLPDHSLVVPGNDHPVMERLYGRAGDGSPFSLEVRENPWNPKAVIGFIRGTSREEIEAAFPKIFHYGKYSRVSFQGGRNIEKKVAPSERGIVRQVAPEPIGENPRRGAQYFPGDRREGRPREQDRLARSVVRPASL